MTVNVLDVPMYSDNELRAACAKAAAAEREACAQLAEQRGAICIVAGLPGAPLQRLPFADLIRARDTS